MGTNCTSPVVPLALHANKANSYLKCLLYFYRLALPQRAKKKSKTKQTEQRAV